MSQRLWLREDSSDGDRKWSASRLVDQLADDLYLLYFVRPSSSAQLNSRLPWQAGAKLSENKYKLCLYIIIVYHPIVTNDIQIKFTE